MLKHDRSDWFVDSFLKNSFLSRSIFCPPSIVIKTNQRNHLFEGPFMYLYNLTDRFFSLPHDVNIAIITLITFVRYEPTDSLLIYLIFRARKYSRQIILNTNSAKFSLFFDTSNSDCVPAKKPSQFLLKRSIASHFDFWRQKFFYVIPSTSAPVG